MEPGRPQFLDFDATKDQISHHLPSFLTQYSLGVSLLGLLFYVTCLSLILVVAYRLRHLMVNSTRRFMRRALKKEDLKSADHLTLEEGHFSNEGKFFIMPSSPQPNSPSPSASRPWVPTMLSRIISSARPRQAAARPSQVPVLRHVHSSSARSAPSLSRSFSVSSLAPKYQNVSTTTAGITGAALTRSTTPPASHRDGAQQANGHMGHAVYTLPRSRNNSQMNLTTLVPRQSSSRGGSSGQQTPTHGSFHDGE